MHPDTNKLLEEDIGGTLQDMGVSRLLSKVTESTGNQGHVQQDSQIGNFRTTKQRSTKQRGNQQNRKSLHVTEQIVDYSQDLQRTSESRKQQNKEPC